MNTGVSGENKKTKLKSFCQIGVYPPPANTNLERKDRYFCQLKPHCTNKDIFIIFFHQIDQNILPHLLRFSLKPHFCFVLLLGVIDEKVSAVDEPLGSRVSTGGGPTTIQQTLAIILLPILLPIIDHY